MVAVHEDKALTLNILSKVQHSCPNLFYEYILNKTILLHKTKVSDQLVQDKLTSNEEQSISGILALEPSSTQSTNILEEATNKVNNAKRTKVLF